MPIFRFTYTHETAGSVRASEPEGWIGATIGFERHPEFHSLIEYFKSEAFGAYGSNGAQDGRRDWLKNVERTYGPDAEISVLIEVSFDEGYRFEDLYTGLIAVASFVEVLDFSHELQLGFTQDSFWTKFINRFDTPVNIQSPTSLDDDDITVYDPIALNLISQKLRTRTHFLQDQAGLFCPVYDASFTSPDFQVCVDTDEYLQIDWSKILLDELKTKYTIGLAGNSNKPVNIVSTDFEGEYTLDLNFGICVMNYQSAGPVVPAHYQDCDTVGGIIDCYIQFNNEDPILLTKTNFGTSPVQWSEFSYSGTRNFLVGDQIRIFGIFTSAGSLGYGYNGITRSIAQPVFLGTDNSGIQWSGGVTPVSFNQSIDSYLRITADTIYPDTQCPGFLVHDIGAAISDRIIGQNDTFYSEYLGSTQTIARQYESAGCLWEHAAIPGLQIRGYSLVDKIFSLSMKDWWEGINPICNMGLGYEIVNNELVIRAEKKSHFYDDSDMSALLSNVAKIKRSYDKDYQFNKAEFGFEKWESEDISGLDDPQTKRTWASRFKNIGKPFTVFSKWIAASLTIETTRRTTIEQSADYKYDNEIFVIAVTQDLGTTYNPKRDEDFDQVNNLINADTRYNISLTPARMFLRWKNILFGCLQSYIGSFWKFSSGEGNYDMSSEMIATGCDDDYNGELLSEKQDIEVTDDFLFLPELFEIDHYLTWEQYKAIRNNPKLAIGISQTDEDHKKFFINDLSYNLVDGSCKIIAWAKEPFDIQNIITAPTEQTFGIFDETFDQTFE